MMNKLQQLERLSSISEAEWLSTLDELAAYIGKRLKGRIKYGAHSVDNLGEDPIGYYTKECILKLYDCDWEWKMEFSITEQLTRIAGSLISANVEKYKAEKQKTIYTDNDNYLDSNAECGDDSDLDDNFENIVLGAAAGDDELELYALSVFDYRSFDDIANSLGIDKPRVYYLQKKLKRKIESLLNTEKVLS